jgi:hypothetical protein
MLGFPDIFLIHMIRRQRDLRKIIQEIIEQYLSWQHREERQKKHCSYHTKHIPEIGTQSHHHIFHRISECFSPFYHAIQKLLESFPYQDDISSLFGYIYSIVYRYPHISSFERRSVIDAISEIAYDESSFPKHRDDPVFLAWRQSCKDIRLHHLDCEFFIIHHIQIQIFS